MASLITKLHCDSCDIGIVKLTVKKSKTGIVEISVKDCDSCKKPHGMKSIQNLTQVAP